MNLRETGLLRANPHAQKENTLRLSKGCDCMDISVCKDDVVDAAVAAGDTLESFTFNAAHFDEPKVYTFDEPIAVEEAAEIEGKVAEILCTYEVFPAVNVDWENDLLQFSHYGAGEVTELTFTTAGAITPDRKCTIVQYCSSNFITNGDDGQVLTVTPEGGAAASYTVAGNAFVVGDDVANAASADAIKVAIEGAIPDVVATVIVDDAAAGFAIKIETLCDSVVDLDGTELADCCPTEMFV